MTLYEEKLNRINKAVALEPVDKVPFVPCGTSIYAKIEGVKLGDYVKDMDLNYKVNLRALDKIGGVDGIQNMVFDPKLLATAWLSEVKVPGVHLSDNELWQIHEQELVKQEDYDVILKKGFFRWYQDFLRKKLDNPMQYAPRYFWKIIKARKPFKKAGYVCIGGPGFSSPFEMFCGGRSMESFLIDDLMEIPDKVDEVFKKVHTVNKTLYKLQLKLLKPYGAWIGGWRGTPGTVNKEMFERFSWGYMKDLALMLLSRNVVPIFHLDSDWERGLEYFRELPKGRCIMALDGNTNIHKAKEIVGDMMCIMGDVPAEMLAFGTPDKVYDYCMNLIKTIGPTGFILSSGCDIPFNAKLENVQMMGKACLNAAKNN
ncbi:MAG: uroporphyrinogen decarboxylase family protein [Smithella sp.]